MINVRFRFVTGADGNRDWIGVIYRHQDLVFNIWDLSEPKQKMPGDMRARVADADRVFAALATVDNGTIEMCPSVILGDMRLRAPNSNLPNIYCVGLNYRQHPEEFQGKNSSLPAFLIYFGKSSNTDAAAVDVVALPTEASSHFDYEGELAVVLGREGKHIKHADAEAYVFGYMCLNDLTARDMQRRQGQSLIGKVYRLVLSDGAVPGAATGVRLAAAIEIGDLSQRRCSSKRQHRQSHFRCAHVDRNVVGGTSPVSRRHYCDGHAARWRHGFRSTSLLDGRRSRRGRDRRARNASEGFPVGLSCA